MIAPINQLLQGLIVGIFFGFFLQKGRVSKFDVIVNQLLLKDFTVLKIMLTAVIIGGFSVYTMLGFGLIDSISIQAVVMQKVIVGSIIFGIGMAVLGYCPGTTIAAIGDGAKDAIVGALGLLTGAALYAELFPWVKAYFNGFVLERNMTLATIVGIPPMLILVVVAIAAFFGFKFISKYE